VLIEHYGETPLTIVVDHGSKESEFHDGSFELLRRRRRVMHRERRESSEANGVVSYRGCKLVVDSLGHGFSGDLVRNSLKNSKATIYYL
jgi:hypothetical protein